jgi:hypothetical protein
MRFYIVTIFVISSVFGIAIEFIASHILLLYPFVSKTKGYLFTKTNNIEGKFYLPESLFRTSRYYNKGRKNRRP